MEYIEFTGTVARFPGKGGWYYLLIPDALTEALPVIKWGLIKIRANVGQTEWETSILPYGNGKRFIALKAPVRKKEEIDLGDEVTIGFKLLI